MVRSKILVTAAEEEAYGNEIGKFLSPLHDDVPDADFVIRGPMAEGRMEGYSVRSGLRLVACDVTARCNYEFTIERDYPGVALWLVLDGRCGGMFQHSLGRENLVDLLPGRDVLGTVQPGRSNWMVCGGLSHRGVYLRMDADTAADLVSDYCEATPGSLHPFLVPSGGPSRCIHRTLPPELAVVAQQVLNCPVEEPVRHLFMESKALEILALHLASLASSGLQGEALLNRRERERLEEARHVLDMQYTDPPSLAALSRRVGLNAFKLKRGFKDLFHTTVFGYVRRLRMEKALTMLQTGEMNVGEVACAMGYTCFGHFSVAFRKRFGISPSDVKKSRARK